MTPKTRNEILQLLNSIQILDQEITQIVEDYLKDKTNISREEFKNIPEIVMYEILAEWLRQHRVSFDTAAIERLYKGIKSLQTGAQIDVSGGYFIQLTRDQVVLKQRLSV